MSMSTGAIEINCSNIQTLNECRNLPFIINDYSSVKEELRMRYRYIDLRSKLMQHNLRLRSELLLNTRKFLCEKHGFVDVETPTLFRRTPGGAQEFIVPTKSPGDFYSLPQSPQQFKQLLMAGGIDRYMQIAKCYRDEGAKPDRQPEFTQLDLELSFTTKEEVKSLVEELLMEIWPDSLPSISTPFKTLTFKEAMEEYGSDKPDLRYDCQVKDISNKFSQDTVFPEHFIVKAVCIPHGCELLSAKQIRTIGHSVKEQFDQNLAAVAVQGDSTWKSPLTKYMQRADTMCSVNETLEAKAGDLIFICAQGDWMRACQAIGKCRTLAADYLSANNTPLYPADDFRFLWVENFPLFEKNDSMLQSAHHPFTAPVEEDRELMSKEPTSVRGQHYDLVLNGCEIGGGSIRIHDADLQRYVIEDILGEDSAELSHLLDALASGCPPHGGIALGLDRLLAIMCGAGSIRDVIAFPKSSLGADLMCGAPCKVNSTDLRSYNISIISNTKSE